MQNEDDRVAELAISEALSELGKNPWNWLRDSVYGSSERNESVVERIREMIGNVGNLLGWRMEVPEEDVPGFIVNCLGRDLLRSSSVRSLLVLHRASRGEAGLYSINEALGIGRDANAEQAAESAAEMSWTPSSFIAKRMVSVLGLPPRYAEAGTSDDRPRMEVAEPIRNLPPLLPFQESVKEQIIATLEERSRAIVVMPTGAGKTRTTVEAATHHLISQGRPISGVVWLADRDELCEQAFQTFKQIIQHRSDRPVQLWRYWGSNTVGMAIEGGRRVVPGVVVTSIQQLRNRLESNDPAAQIILESSRIVIIDEAHRNLDWVEMLIRHMTESGEKTGIIGLTATPLRRERSETGRLARAFANNAIAPVEGGAEDPDSIAAKLTDEGILAAREDVFASEMGISITSGSKLSRFKEAFAVITGIRDRGASSILAFAEDVEQSKRLAMSLRLRGIAARHLDGSTPTMERRETIEAFRTGEVEVLVNYGILTTGFDAPNTDAVAIFRLTDDMAQPVIQQMIGRGLRGPRFGGTESCKVFIRGEN